MNKTITKTADPFEIDTFNKISETWWERKSRPMLNMLNHIRIPLLRKGLFNVGTIDKERCDSSKPFEGLTILDAGCGGGIFTEELTRLGGTVVGIDLAASLIAVANKHNALNPSLPKIAYHLESVEYHAVQNFEKYDVLIASEVLDHVLEKENFVKDCVKCLKPGGTFFITTKNQTFLSWLFYIFFFEILMRIIPRGGHDTKKFSSPNETKKLLAKYGCKTVMVQGTVFNYFTATWHCIPVTWISYVLHAVKIKKN